MTASQLFGVARGLPVTDGEERCFFVTRMSGASFRRWRTTNGLTQATLGLWMGVHSSTIGRWECGIRPVPRWVERIVRSRSMIPRGRRRPSK